MVLTLIFTMLILNLSLKLKTFIRMGKNAIVHHCYAAWCV